MKIVSKIHLLKPSKATLHNRESAVKRIKRNPDIFEALNLFAASATKHGYKLDQTEDIDRFANSVASSLKTSQENQKLLHGKRVEALFAHVAGAMGKCIMVKGEDAGEIFVEDVSIQPPDYRLILLDRTHLLVEVKNCHADGLEKLFKLKREYFEKLERYAELNSAPLKIAIYFSRWKRWCLLSKRAFKDDGEFLTTSITNAFSKNEMSTIGDVNLATLPNLRLVLMADPAEAQFIDENGQASITFRSSRIFCAGKEITDESATRIAFQLMRFGDWIEDAVPIIEHGKLMGVDFTARPESPAETDGQPFEIIGTFSSIISAAYAEYTVIANRLVALDAPVDPEVFAVHIPIDYCSESLPIWRLVLQPNWDFDDNSRLPDV